MRWLGGGPRTATWHCAKDAELIRGVALNWLVPDSATSRCQRRIGVRLGRMAIIHHEGAKEKASFEWAE